MIDRLAAAAALAWLDASAGAMSPGQDSAEARDRAEISPPAALAAALGHVLEPTPAWLQPALASLETDAVTLPPGERHGLRFARARFTVRLAWLGLVAVDLVLHDFGVSVWFDPVYAATGHVLHAKRLRLSVDLAQAGLRLDAFATRGPRRGDRPRLPTHDMPVAVGDVSEWVVAAELDPGTPPELAVAIARVCGYLDGLERQR